VRALQAYTLAGKAAVMSSVVFPELFFFENCTGSFAVEETWHLTATFVLIASKQVRPP
jgi:hypothetical protein